MNQKTFNKNISSTQATYAPEKTMHQNNGLSYKFEIMDDKNIYSISFEGKLTEEETKEMLEAVQKCLYEKIPDAIQMYLEQHNIACSNFISSRIPLNHTKAMELAELLLNSDNCSGFDSYFWNTDIYYLIVDHQKWVAENCCHGCYFAVKKTLTESESSCKYNIIGQTFRYNEVTDDENCYIAIRESRNNGSLYNIVVSDSEPVLPSFGCVDMLGILLNIDSIQTVEQIEKIAVK